MRKTGNKGCGNAIRYWWMRFWFSMTHTRIYRTYQAPHQTRPVWNQTHQAQHQIHQALNLMQRLQQTPLLESLQFFNQLDLKLTPISPSGRFHRFPYLTPRLNFHLCQPFLPCLPSRIGLYQPVLSFSETPTKYRHRIPIKEGREQGREILRHKSIDCVGAGS